MLNDGAEHIGFQSVILDESKFVDDSGKSAKERRLNPDRRADANEPSRFAHLRDELRRKNDRDMVEYLGHFSTEQDATS